MPTVRQKVLFIIPTLGGGGAERVFITLLRHLDRTRFEPHLGLLAKTGAYLPEVPEDVPIHDLHVSRVRRCLPRLVRLIRRLRPRAVLSTLRELNLALVAAKPLLPPGTRLFVRETAPVATDVRTKSRFPGAWHWLCRLLYARADRVICVSENVLDGLASLGVRRDKLARIYSPVDIDFVRREAATSSPYRSAGLHLVAAGRLTREKGFDVLLEAMQLVSQHVPAARLTILGEGPLGTELRQQRDALGLSEVVTFAGFQPNPYPYFKHAHALVLSSRYEGLPVVVLEALALGTRVIAVDCPGGVREIVHAYSRARLVPNLDAHLLAQAIVGACEPDDGKGAASEAGDEELLAQFRVERVVDEYESVLSGEGQL